METENNIIFRPRTGKTSNGPLLPELDVYVHLLVVVHLLDTKRYEEVRKITPLHLSMKQVRLHNNQRLLKDIEILPDLSGIYVLVGMDSD